MATKDSNPTAKRASFFLYALVLFHLPAGRIVYSFGRLGDVKVGENIENLLPLLLVARLLTTGLNFEKWKERLKPVRESLFLIFGGLAISAVYYFGEETVEEALRFFGRALCGFLLAEWIWKERLKNSLWFLAFFFGFLWLIGWTPWGELGDPNLEGPFTHRNIQSAFLLLSAPLLYLILADQKGTPLWWRAPSLFFLLISAAFVLLSRSRSGVLGILVACFLLGGCLISRQKLRSNQMAAIGGMIAVILVLAGFFLFPRFKNFAEEMGNPFHRSRTAIWAAAVDGWRNPAVFLLGAGMDDSFDKVLVDSPTGNLNYRYRRAHYPHCLYLQWLYWGGLLALLGWFLLLQTVWLESFSKHSSASIIVVGSCLLGYAAMEFFDSALRDPRVASLFFLNLGLLVLVPEKEQYASGGGSSA